ncbi:MAG: hypothetical protein Q8L48_37870 [Archangium sp.]|nr:hypothetical protein [Archangium sp.]
MSTVRYLLHILLGGVHVFLTSLTLLVQLASTGTTFTGVATLTLLGAWAGASSTLRTKQSLITAAVGIALLLLLAVRGQFNFYLNLWVAAVMVPLSALLWLLVAWRRWGDDGDPAHTLRATH